MCRAQPGSAETSKFLVSAGSSSIGNTGPEPNCGMPSSRVSRSASSYSLARSARFEHSSAAVYLAKQMRRITKELDQAAKEAAQIASQSHRDFLHVAS